MVNQNAGEITETTAKGVATTPTSHVLSQYHLDMACWSGGGTLCSGLGNLACILVHHQFQAKRNAGW